jgi:outer membrane immunogenic protein
VVVPLPAASSTIASTPVKIDWALVGGVRVGYAMDRWLPYALAGAVVGGGTATGGGSATHTGYTFGLGVDYALTDQWTVGARYAYVSMDKKLYGGAGPFGWNGNSVVATLNYKLY